MSQEQSPSEAWSWMLPHPDARWRYFLYFLAPDRNVYLNVKVSSYKRRERKEGRRERKERQKL